MNLEARKYHLIQELFNIDKESVIDTLERVLKSEKEESQEISVENKKELDNRLKNYRENPNDVLDWDDVKDKLVVNYKIKKGEKVPENRTKMEA